MTAVQFNAKARRAGLLIPRVGPLPVSALVKLCEAPEPLRKGYTVNNKPPSILKGLSVLIQCKLAMLDRAAGAYVPTAEGREYLGKLKAEGLA